MPSRKRRAPEPLLPIRIPKQPRLTFRGYDGGTPSPSENERILSRWTRIGQEFLDLVADTAMALLPIYVQGQTEGSVPVDATPSSSQASSSLVSTPQQTPSPRRVSDGPLTINLSTPKQNSTLKPRSPPTVRDTDTRFYITKEPTINEDDEVPEIANFSTPQPQTVRSTKSWPLTPPPDSSSERELKSVVVPGMTRLRLEDSVNSSLRSSQTSDSIPSSNSKPGSRSSQSSSKASKSESLRRRIRNRPHIYQKVHKARVHRAHTALREELFLLKKKTGFTSGFSDFKGLLDYQRQLQNIDLEHAPLTQRPSSSFGASMRNQRRPPESEEDFLQRAIDNAKATLDSPRPPKPFSPTFEQLEVLQRKKDDDIERRLRPPVPPLPSTLPPDEDKQVSALLQKRGVVSKFAREQVSDQDLSRLRPGQWLNDEIINFYGAMILARSEESKENPSQSKMNQPKHKPLNAHYFSSFFWVKLTQEGYDKGRLAKWTKKVDIFSKDVILMPVNHGNAHWTAAAINFRQKRIESYDSMNMAKERVWKALRTYIEDEHKNKKKTTFDFTGWENWAPEWTPQQENGFDCGVFTCQFLEALSRGEETFNFSQKDMPYLRRRMIWEIGNAKLRDGH